jgi:O-antigen/teichoic acid export membrane protein
LVRLVGVLVPAWSGQPITLRYIALLAILAQTFSTAAFLLASSRRANDLEDHATTSPGTAAMLRRFWQRGPKLTVTYLLIALQNRLDWLLVAGILSKVALANYSIANKLLELPMLIAGTAARTTFPWLSRPDANEDHTRSPLELWRRIFALCSGLLCGSLFFWLPTVVRLFVGNKYAGAETAIELMILPGSIFMLNQYFFYSLLARKLERDYAWLLLVATILQIIVDLIAMPVLGIVGAVFGMLAMGTLLHLGQIGLLIRRRVLQSSEIRRLEGFLWASIAIAGVLWMVSGYLVLNTVIFWLAAGSLGNFLLLRRDGRAQLVQCVHQARAAMRSSGI